MRATLLNINRLYLLILSAIFYFTIVDSQSSDYYGYCCPEPGFGKNGFHLACIDASPGLLNDEPLVESKMAINYRGNINNSRLKFETEKKGRVVFLGGSITYNPGWRDMVCDYLKERFPETEFEFINAGIPSTGSTPGAMRFSRDVLANGPVDLLFEEAAVNDPTNGTKSERQIRGMEGIVYQALTSNPFMDIIILHFVDQDKIADYSNGRIPEVIVNHEKVADYYNIPSINLAKEVNDRILAGEFTWADDFKNLHPSPFGQALYFRTIKQFFEQSWKTPPDGKLVSKILPSALLDPYSYVKGHFIQVEKAKLGAGWKFFEKWLPADKVKTRPGFVEGPVIEASVAGASLKLKFKGSTIGIFVTSGPDAGMLEYSIDGSDFKVVDQFTQWSKQLHLPWLIILDDELKDGRHTLVLKIAKDRNSGSVGNACRIHHFTVSD